VAFGGRQTADGPPSAVFFDAGGTLIRPRASVGEIYAGLAREFGVVADAAELERGFRTAFAEAPPLAFPGVAAGELLAREQNWWRAIVRAAFAAHWFADFEAYFRTVYAEFARAEVWEVYDDVFATLETLRARGITLGVISNFDQRLLPLLHDLRLEPYFASATFSSRAGFAKPDARIFAHALHRHGIAPAAALHIGDSEREDVAGARAAGLRALLVRSDGSGLTRILGELREPALP